MGVSATISKEAAVNPFVEHHQQSIRFQYSCFDRMLLNAVVQPMQRPAPLVGYLDKCRHVVDHQSLLPPDLRGVPPFRQSIGFGARRADR